jgi:hypothetical protein
MQSDENSEGLIKVSATNYFQLTDHSITFFLPNFLI